MASPSTMRTTLSSTTEESSVSPFAADIPDSTGILNSIATALRPNRSALLILILSGLLGLSLLFILALLILLKRRSKQSMAVEGMERNGQQAPSQSTEHYSLDPTEQRRESKDGTERVNNVRESLMSENDYELPDEIDDDYENAGEINTATIGRR